MFRVDIKVPKGLPVTLTIFDIVPTLIETVYFLNDDTYTGLKSIVCLFVGTTGRRRPSLRLSGDSPQSRDFLQLRSLSLGRERFWDFVSP